MDFRAYFKHMETSLALYAYAEDKFKGRVEKYPLKAVAIDVTFSVDGRLFVTHVHVMMTKNATFDVTSSDEQSMYAAVDLAADKLENQLRRHKEKVHSHRGGERVLMEPAFRDGDEIDAAEVISFEQARRQAQGRTAQGN